MDDWMTTARESEAELSSAAFSSGLRAPRTVRKDRRAILEDAIARAREGLLRLQKPDGHWCFELEADCTIPAEYVLMMHFLDEIDEDLEARLCEYLRRNQADHGGWPLYHGGELELSCTVKCYWALKMAGADPDEPHMKRARAAILERGGAARCNVFTRIALALFGEIPWRGVPFLPVEIMLLPRWFPFHILKVSYWSRTVMVPLAILCSLKAKARNPKDIHIGELFVTPPEQERNYFPTRSRLNRLFLAVERTARRFEPLIPGFVRRRAIDKAHEWFVARLNGVDGLGGIFPAMVNAYEALDLLGYDYDHPDRAQCRDALRGLIAEHEGWAYVQPCLSPVWDTSLACLALEDELDGEMADEKTEAALHQALVWLEGRQVLDGPADWREYRPRLAPGGWAFQYQNPHYVDLDDTSAVTWALIRGGKERFRESIHRAADWVRGMQSKNGGFASFDADNTHEYLNEIPFADHGALLDPPTADVSARCAALLAILDRDEDEECLSRCTDYLIDEQEADGPWYGRWGTNYIYGTWCVLAALELLDDERKEGSVRKAVDWLKSVQREDGSWGEDNDTYFFPGKAGSAAVGTTFQTAWALLGLLAAGEGDSPEVRRGVRYLLSRQRADGLWEDELFTAPGFPRVFYLRYHGYSKYFPLWALARYRQVLQKQGR